jgi:plastocyanin
LAAAVCGCGGGGGGYGGSTPTSPTPTTGQVVVVDLTEHAFTPRSVEVQAGDTVRWVLRGSDATQTVTARHGAFDSGAAFTRSGATYERTFGSGDDGRIFDYSCQAHGDCCAMRGSVRVGSGAPPPSPGYE